MVLFVYSVWGCAVNPVTGKQELRLLSESTEIELGSKNYMPARQMQGGDYVADRAVVEYVRKVGMRIASVADRKLPYEFVVVNDSTPNAWAMPGGKIAIHRGLLTELEDEAELAAVLAHEVVHAAARHSAKQMERALFLQAALLLTAAVVENSERGEDWTGILAVGGAQVAAFLLTQKFSRDAEREADRYGMLYMVRAGYDPAAAVTLQETFLRLSEGKDEGWLTGLLSTHPPSKERIEANRRLLATLPQGGIRGRERYQQRMAHLFRTKPAYSKYEKGLKALKEKEPHRALSLAEEAIAIEPKEALFYLLRGDALKEIGSFDEALNSYTEAERLNPEYYYAYQQKGLLLYRLGRKAEAESSLKRGVGLLATAPALYTLGRIALEQGNTEEAKEYFKEAKESSSREGLMAWRELLGIELPEGTWQYVDTELMLSKEGTLMVKVTNLTPVALEGVVVEVGTAYGTYKIGLDGVLGGRDSVVVSTGLPVPSPKALRHYRAEALSAYPAD